MSTCTVDGCERPHKAHGLCTTHYARQRRHGDTATVKRAGRPRSPRRTQVEALLGEDFGSRRTFERYHRAMRLPYVLAHYGLITDEAAHDWTHQAITEATRPNGTLNVSKLLEAIEERVAVTLADD